jgi:hypothetical protein
MTEFSLDPHRGFVTSIQVEDEEYRIILDCHCSIALAGWLPSRRVAAFDCDRFATSPQQGKLGVGIATMRARLDALAKASARDFSRHAIAMVWIDGRERIKVRAGEMP